MCFVSSVIEWNEHDKRNNEIKTMSLIKENQRKNLKNLKA